MPTMSYDQFLQYLLSKGLRNVGPAAEALRQQEGIQVDGLPNIPGMQGAPAELPALPGQQPVYNPQPPQVQQPQVQQPQVQQPQVQQPQAMSSPLEDFSNQWRQLYTENQQIERDASDFRRKQFEDATRTLQEQRAGPSRQERLLALSSALLSPTRTPGFKGALGNVAPVLSELATLKRQSEQGRSKQLYDLQQQYLGNGIEDRRSSVKGRMGLLELAQKMNKPEKTRSGFNPITGELVDMDSGEPIRASGPAVGTTKVWRGRQYRFMGGDQYEQKNWQEVR